MAITEGLNTTYELKYWQELHRMRKMGQRELFVHSEFLLWRSLLLLQEYNELNSKLEQEKQQVESMNVELESMLPDSLG